MSDFTVGDTLHFLFTTRAFATGIPTVLIGTPVLGAFEDAVAAPITAGVTVTVDVNSVVGLNRANIVATGGNGFEAGKSYSIAITTGTVGGVSVVGEVVAFFSLGRAPALQPTTLGNTLDVAATGEAGVDLGNTIGTLDAAQIGADAITAAKIANGAIDAATFAAGAINAAAIATDAITNAKIAAGAITVSEAPNLDAAVTSRLASADINLTAGVLDEVAALTGHTAQTGDSFARLGAPAAASIAADLLAIDNFVDGLETTIGVAGAGLSDLGGMSTAMQAEVLAEVNTALDTAISELTQAQPTSTPTVRTALMLMYMALRNRLDVQTSGTDALEVRNAAGTIIAKKLLTDDGSDYSEALMVSGP